MIALGLVLRWRKAELPTTHFTCSGTLVCSQNLHPSVEMNFDCVCQPVFARAALNASGASQKGRTWKHQLSEEWDLLCHLAVLWEQTEILPQACVFPSGFNLLAELGKVQRRSQSV